MIKVIRHAFSFHTDKQLTAALDEALRHQPDISNGDDDGRGVGEESDADEEFVPVT